MFRLIKLPEVYLRQDSSVQKRAYNILMLLIFVYFYALGMFIADIILTGRLMFVLMETVLMSVAMSALFYSWYKGRMDLAINIAGIIGLIFTMIIFFEPISLRFYMQILMVMVITFLGYSHKYQYVITFAIVMPLMIMNTVMLNNGDIRYMVYVTVTFAGTSYLLMVIKGIFDSEIAMSSELKKTQEVDSLTQLPNRRSFENNLRYSDVMDQAYIWMMDMDHFKMINDHYGHIRGDEVLSEMGKLMLGLKGETLRFFRWGGEEFFCVFIGDEGECITQAETFRKTVENHDFGLKSKVTVSIGITNTSRGEEGFEKAFKRADQALYLAKKNGRNQVKYKLLDDLS